MRKEHTVVELVDDLDGTPAAGTVQVGYAGTWYELELSEGNAAKLLEALQPYLAVGRRVAPAKPQAKKPRPQGAGSKLQQVREWAVAAGYHVPERGPLRKDVVAAYRAAQATGREPSSVGVSAPDPYATEVL